MSMRRAWSVAAGALLLSACATAPPSPAPVAAPTPSPAVTAPPPPPAGPSPRQALAARHRERARQLERDESLRRASDEWKIALTIDPTDPEARAGLRDLEARIEQLVADRVGAARAAMARGVQLEARRQYLLALALDPANRPAFEALQGEVRDVESVLHTVRAGDTLTGLALRYYGDRSRAEVIWETNHLPANPKLTAGTRLKIPEIPGVPFIHPEAKRPAPAPPQAAPPAPSASEPPAPPPAPEEYQEVNPLLAEAREALDKSDWAEALSDVDRFLQGHPNHKDGLAIKKVALYRQGKAYLEARRYDDSYRSLTILARIEPAYEDAAQLLREARAKAVEQHYGRGVRLYREEKLSEAIAEWRVVLEMEPQHGNARRNIEQAERLLRALEERQKKR